jgi:hypothetical protein
VPGAAGASWGRSGGRNGCGCSAASPAAAAGLDRAG